MVWFLLADSVGQNYLLAYPGVTFMFPIPTEFMELYQSGELMPVEFPDKTTPLATKVLVHYAAHTELCSARPVPPAYSSLCAANDAVVCSLDQGTVSVCSQEAVLQFGGSPQQVRASNVCSGTCGAGGALARTPRERVL